MPTILRTKSVNIKNYLSGFVFNKTLFEETTRRTQLKQIDIRSGKYPKFVNEFWTAKQRQGNGLHEISYRACFKSQLPNFFINLLSSPLDIVYDPFSGRGTTVVEAAILGRNIIANDVNPLSEILSRPRLSPPQISLLRKRLDDIPFKKKLKADIDLSMFFHPDTESEVVSIKRYLEGKKKNSQEDDIDAWIRMVATNRLTGHSKGFFSVYTLPPNQAVAPERQKIINEKRDQKPCYRNTREIILRKTRSLLRDTNFILLERLEKIRRRARFLTEDSRNTKAIRSGGVQLTITSPPFLDVVQYAKDNWLRCWFNKIDAEAVDRKITMAKKIEEWNNVMGDVFKELYRITKGGGYVAFEVGEVKNGKINLEEEVIPLGLNAGFHCEGVMVNEQNFTKTSNIWGIANNNKGTNSNRIVIFSKI